MKDHEKKIKNAIFSIFNKHRQEMDESGILQVPDVDDAKETKGVEEKKPDKGSVFAKHRQEMDESGFLQVPEAEETRETKGGVDKKEKKPDKGSVFAKYRQEMDESGIFQIANIEETRETKGVGEKKPDKGSVFAKYRQEMDESGIFQVPSVDEAGIGAVPAEYVKDFYVFPTNSKKASPGETLGIISGIYGNPKKLKKTLKFLSGKINYLVCLGDIVGYECDENKVLHSLKLIQKYASIVLPGDHEFLHHEKILRTPEDQITFSHKMLETLLTQDKHEITFLKNLQSIDIKYILDECSSFLLAHASLCSYSGYTDDHHNISNCFSSMERGQVLLVGHSYTPEIIVKSNTANTWKTVEFTPGKDMYFEVRKEKYIFSIGAVVNPLDESYPSHSLIFKIVENLKNFKAFKVRLEVIN